MKHNMHLGENEFNKVKSGLKIIEGRLNDEKRQKIKKGDIIIFENGITNEKIKTKVINLENYKTFEEMYDSTNKLDWNYKGTKEHFINYFQKVYSKERELKYGVVAIYINIIK